MSRKFRLTRLELKRQRDALERYERYLPMLKLKQQQLQIALRAIQAERDKAREALAEAEAVFAAYEAVLAAPAGLDVRALARPTEVRTARVNIAGLEVPVFEDATFAAAEYSLFGTPLWVDRALIDLRAINRCRAELDILDRRDELVRAELTRIIQRVNLFEKVKIPAAREAIRMIRIALGDEQTAAVVRAKIAKIKLEAVEHAGREAPAAQEAAP